jgi:hypothetical protein
MLAAIIFAQSCARGDANTRNFSAEKIRVGQK